MGPILTNGHDASIRNVDGDGGGAAAAANSLHTYGQTCMQGRRQLINAPVLVQVS